MGTDTLRHFHQDRGETADDARHAVPVGGDVSVCGRRPGFIWETIAWPGPDGPPTLCPICFLGMDTVAPYGDHQSDALAGVGR